MDIRWCIPWAALALATGPASSPGRAGRAAGAAFSFEVVAERARARAAAPWRASPPLPKPLQGLDYDSYRLIAFDHAAAIWKGSDAPFLLECHHRGYLFAERVDLYLVESGRSRRLALDRRMFQYRGKLAGLAVPADVGFAGFRVLGKFAASREFLEIASFLGASYFRAIGEGQVYGTSARGLAIDIGLPRTEEFPAFREFWIERPAAGARLLRLWGLLDSPSVCGAYEFALTPGAGTVMDIRARLFFRRKPEKIGLGPLSSMWMWGDGRPAPPGDPRPRVHDADGLLIHAGEGWQWRPLTRLRYPSLSRFAVADLRRFGLLQRQRRPAAFGDDEAKYHLRPSVWITPKQPWRAGAVELLELPAEHEGIDNIAAWFVPAGVEQGAPLDLEYTVEFRATEPEHRLARATATRVVRRAGAPLRLEIDFQGAGLAQLRDDRPPACKVSAVRGAVSNVQCQQRADGRWQVQFELVAASKEPVELWASLERAGEKLTETWRYLCPN